MGLAGKRVRGLHDYALRVKSNVRELAKQGVRLPDQVQGVLQLRRANLSTQARIAIMTLAGNSLSFSDVMLMSFYEIPRNTTHVGHTLSMCHKQERQALRQQNRKM